MTSILLLMAALSAQSSQVALVQFETAGLSDEQSQEVKTRLLSELSIENLEAVDVSDDFDLECLKTPACLSEQTQQAFVRMRLRRAGPQIQTLVMVVTREGQALMKEERTIGTDPSESLMGPNWPTIAKDISPPLVEKVPTESRPAVKAKSSQAIKWWGWTGLGVATLGAIVGVTGAVLTLGEASVLSDPTSLGADKERAQSRAPVYLTLTAIGIVATGVGASLFIFSLPESE